MDHSAILPNGKSFEFWEVPVTYKKEIHVNQNHPMADDANEGTLEKPLKTINAAANIIHFFFCIFIIIIVFCCISF